MTDRNQFEAMLEALINEDQETAKEIFHNIVVGKSREIYEELLAEDFDISEGENPFADKEEEEEGEDEAEVGAEEEGDEEGEEGDEEGEESPFGDEEGEEEGEGGDMEDRVMDLEDALDELKSEFEQLMAGEEHEEEENPGVHGGELDGMLGGAEGGADDMFGGAEEEDESMFMREYKDMVKVAPAKMGDNGVNTKSTVAGKNDMGGTTANIAQGGTMGGKGVEAGLLKPTTKEENFGNVNVPGGKAGKTGFKKQEPGHGAEKKGAKPVEDKGAQSPINGVKSRAK